jgi:hypothetical protein
MKIMRMCARMDGIAPDDWFTEMERVIEETGQASAYVWQSIGTLGGGK